MSSPGTDQSVSEFLSDLSLSVIIAATSGDSDAAKALAQDISRFEKNARKGKERELAAYFRVLRGILLKQNVARHVERLVGPYRAGYDQIIAEIANASQPSSGAETQEISLQDWIASLATAVVTAVKQGAESDRSALVQELDDISGRMHPDDTDFLNYVEMLKAVLAGQDTRRLVIQLVSPYRDAALSMLQLLAATDTSEFALHNILDRIQHNTTVALQQQDIETREAVANSLAALVDKISLNDPTMVYLEPIVAGACALLRGEEPPPTVTNLPEPFATTWQIIQEAADR